MWMLRLKMRGHQTEVFKGAGISRNLKSPFSVVTTGGCRAWLGVLSARKRFCRKILDIAPIVVAKS
jgi:hypothetical protein